MPRKTSQKPLKYEDPIQKALSALENDEFDSVGSAATYFKVSRHTLQRRRYGGATRTTSHEMQQYLNNAEESTLLRWIKQYTIAGNPLTILLFIELAQHIRTVRVVHASQSSPSLLQVKPLSRQ